MREPLEAMCCLDRFAIHAVWLYGVTDIKFHLSLPIQYTALGFHTVSIHDSFFMTRLLVSTYFDDSTTQSISMTFR